MSDDGITVSDGPHSRLTSLAARCTMPLEEPGNEDVKAIVLLTDSDEGGIQIHGYEDSVAAMADLFIHMRTVFRSMGKDLQFVAIPDTPEGAE